MACTFAYPYMNGRLHLGHLMIILKTDIAARYRRWRGDKNILFPFGFHCTGMPIYASAMKLQHGDQATRGTLLSMGIPEEDIDKFKDPGHWIEVFPKLALEDLTTGLNLSTDFSRSFITTDRNPYYDSFVKWQFRILMKQDRLKYESRPCIYSTKDRQPCADHDRQSGEGVKPKLYHLCWKHAVEETGGVFYLHDPSGTTPDKDIKGECRYVLCGYTGELTDYLRASLRAQGYATTVYDGVPVADMPAGKVTDLYLPEEEVISRSGDRCLVAVVPQWYLKYSDPAWKQVVLEVIEGMTIHNAELRKQLVIAAENLDDWCVSREYGLGSRMPDAPNFWVDSLSDSTVYMAYYTVCHLLHGDLYGDEQLIPAEHIDDQFWNAAFFGNPYDGPVDRSVITEARRQFVRYYPPRLRVSGKDLIYNHLIMSIYNHIAVFGKDMCCSEYLVYGHAKINGKKMSKSTGNFVTVAQAKERYPCIEALRVLLAEAGDNLEDANIRLKDYSNIVTSLEECFLKDCPRVYFSLDDAGTTVMEGREAFYLNMLAHCYTASQEGFQRGRFREAIVSGWRRCEKICKTYQRSGSCEAFIMNVGQLIKHITLCLITGYEPTTPPPLWLEQYDVNPEWVRLYDLVEQIEKGTGIVCLNQIMKRHETIIQAALSGPVDICYDDTPLHPKRDPYRVKPVFKTT